jgi:hypothetical protein
MAEREILTLTRKKPEPVIVVVQEPPPAVVELPVIKKPKKIKPNWEIIYQLAEAYPQTFFTAFSAPDKLKFSSVSEIPIGITRSNNFKSRFNNIQNFIYCS